MKDLLLYSGLLFGALAGATVVLPQNDTFYEPPSDYSSAANGAILKSRPVPNPLVNLTYESAYQIMYRSEDSLGNATYGVTTVIVPKTANSNMMVSYQWYEDSSYIACAPSYELQVESIDPTYQYLLDLGFYVNTPDYEGPQSEFTAGIQAGHSTLDSVRAALASNSLTGLSSDAKVALWGYSGGSIATGWASQLQPSYASGLSNNLVAAAMGGVVANITAVAEKVDGTIYVGFLPAGFLGLSMAYPQFQSFIKEELEPNATVLYNALSQCMDADLVEFAGQDFFSYFKDGEGVLYQPAVASVMETLTMGANSPSIPMFIYQGLEDEIAPVQNVNQLVDTWCSEGGSITYVQGPGLDHTGEATNGFSAALSYVSAAVHGSSIKNNCGTTTTTSYTTGSSSAASNATSTQAFSNSTAVSSSTTAATTTTPSTNVSTSSSHMATTPIETSTSSASANMLSTLLLVLGMAVFSLV
jgi:hypothetical protein